MQWISILERLPAKAGKYVVKTETALGGNKFDCVYKIHENGKTSWDCSGQIVTHWLDEEKN